MPSRSLNLGVLAHVDAGKTTLTERLLHLAGVVDEPGSVDAGTTRTDSLALERRRGITIKAAVVAFPLGDLVVNVIDTPGHPDFIAEVERVLGVLDGAVLVLSAVEGVQPQTRILMRALQRLRVPPFIATFGALAVLQGLLLLAASTPQGRTSGVLGDAWDAGVDGAEAFMVLAADPRVGDVYVDGGDGDELTVLSLGTTVTVPFGTFEGCLEVQETNPEDPDDEDLIIYAPGVGMVSESAADARIELVEASGP